MQYAGMHTCKRERESVGGPFLKKNQTHDLITNHDVGLSKKKRHAHTALLHLAPGMCILCISVDARARALCLLDAQRLFESARGNSYSSATQAAAFCFGYIFKCIYLYSDPRASSTVLLKIHKRKDTQK